MKKLGKAKLIIIVVAVLLLVGIIGGGVFITHKINSMDVRSTLLTELSKIFPQAEVKIGQVDFKIGLKVKFYGKDVALTLNPEGKRPAQNLFSIKEIKADVPIWAVLIGTSSVDIVLDQPEFSYLEIGKSNNWLLAMGKNEAAPSAADTPAPASEPNESSSGGLALPNITVPAILTRASLNFRLVDLKVHYALKNGQKGEVALTRFIIRNLNFKSSTAIELASKLSLKLPSGPVGMEALLIGDLNLQDLISKEKFSTQLMLDLNDINGQGLGLKAPNIKVVVSTIIDRKGSAVGDLTVSFAERNKIATKYQVQETHVALSDLNVNLMVADLLAMAQMPDLIKGEKAVFGLTGGVQVDLKKEGGLAKINPELKFALDPAIIFQAGPLSGQTKMVGSVKGPQVDLSVTNELLDGTVNFVAHAEVDLNKQPFDLTKLPPVAAELRANNLKMPREFWQKLLYGGESKKKNAAPAKTPVAAAKPVTLPPLPKINFNLNVNQVLIDGRPLEGKGEILVRPDGATTKNLKFTYSGGTMDLTHQTKILSPTKQPVLKNTFTFNLKNLDLNGITAFLPAKIKSMQGLVAAQSKGNVNLALAKKNGLSFEIQANAQGRNVEMVGLDIGGTIAEAISAVPMIDKIAGSIKEINFDAFDVFNAQTVLKENLYDLRVVDLHGHHDSFILRGNGQIRPQGASEMKLEFAENGKVGKEIARATGNNVVPLKLTGPGFSLKPDAGYTIGKLAEQTAKKKAKEVGQKAVKQLGDKLFKGKGDKLLKGLFGH
ncbi:MAG: hypothetical protein J6Y94_03575 [Bacteriovoracaceae bacterium]|nr:hypothetical protein [Bacteriovoracaceae bacterium]